MSSALDDADAAPAVPAPLPPVALPPPLLPPRAGPAAGPATAAPPPSAPLRVSRGVTSFDPRTGGIHAEALLRFGPRADVTASIAGSPIDIAEEG
jgi:hypothetical protein